MNSEGSLETVGFEVAELDYGHRGKVEPVVELCQQHLQPAADMDMNNI